MLRGFLDPGYYKLARNWILRGACGVVGTIGVIWATDWQLILDGCTVAQSRIVTAELEDYFFKITGGNRNA